MDRKTMLKMTLSVCLLLLAIVAAIVKKTPYTFLALPGMLLGVHGDYCLTQTPAVRRRYKEPFLVGAMSFLIGHLFYIAAFLMTPRVSSGAFWGALAVYAILTVVMWLLSIRKAAGAPALRIALLVYALVIGLMASLGFALAYGRGGAFWMVAAGGALFVISDGLIGLNEFAGVKIRNAGTWIWATYVPAQLLIILTGFFT